eukprot:1382194-Prymnesium_polylepis.1
MVPSARHRQPAPCRHQRAHPPARGAAWAAHRRASPQSPHGTWHHSTARRRSSPPICRARAGAGERSGGQRYRAGDRSRSRESGAPFRRARRGRRPCSRRRVGERRACSGGNVRLSRESTRTFMPECAARRGRRWHRWNMMSRGRCTPATVATSGIG